MGYEDFCKKMEEEIKGRSWKVCPYRCLLLGTMCCEHPNRSSYPLCTHSFYCPFQRDAPVVGSNHHFNSQQQKYFRYIVIEKGHGDGQKFHYLKEARSWQFRYGGQIHKLGPVRLKFG